MASRSKAAPAERGKAVVQALRKLYPDAECELTYGSAWQLLVAVILSAQCTDVRVNKVTPALFKKWKTPGDFVKAPPLELEAAIKSTGFYRNKAKNIKGAAALVVEKHAGEVPRTMEELLELPGVARKTANVMLSTAFHDPQGVVVDTHMKRVAYRLGLTRQTDPVKVERDLMKVFAEKDWEFVSHGVIWHGRRVCDARKPRCSQCSLAVLCPRKGVANAA